MFRKSIWLLFLSTCIASVAVAGGFTLSGTVEAKGLRHDGDAVIYLDVEGVTFEPPADPVQVDQVDMEFVPHVTAVLAGTTVEFLNSDAFLHNVFTPDDCAEKFNLGTWPQGETRSFTFQKPCTAVLLCRVHPEMEAYVVALSTPYFAVSDRQGAFAIEGVPAGSYTLEVWHPKLQGSSRQVEVTADLEVALELQR